MIISRGNPFIAAFAAGITEGELVVKGRIGQVPVLGPLFPMTTGSRLSDRQILRSLQSGVGGSFGKFFANVFANPSGEIERAVTANNEQDENPFRKTGEPAIPKTESSAAESTTEAQAPEDKGDSSPPQQIQPPKAPDPPLRQVVTVRPYLLLRVADGGVLHTIPASQPRDGTFESAELGLMDFTVLRFQDPAEWPMTIAVADFNNDGIPDVAVDHAMQGLLRFFYANGDGTYTEGYRIQAGKDPLSVAAGDFNHDGQMDLSLSNSGTGVVTVLFGKSGDSPYRFKSFWLDAYRDYITAADTTGTGTPDVVGMNFANRASVLVDFNQQPDGKVAGRTFDYTPSLTSEVSTVGGRLARLNVALLGSNLSVNIDNRLKQLTNVMNIAAGSDVYLVIGDLNSDGSMIFGVATPKK